MKKLNARIIKSLTELKLRGDVELTPEQEEMFQRAIDPNKEYLHQVEKLFLKKKTNK
jgi:hypothetical protein